MIPNTFSLISTINAVRVAGAVLPGKGTLWALLTLLAVAAVAGVSGYILSDQRALARRLECLNRVSVIPQSEVCTYFFIPNKACANARHRYAYAYRALVLDKCLLGR